MDKEKRNYYLKYGIIGLILVILIPLIIDHLIIGNSIPSNINNSDWVAFLGAYIGAILGAIATLGGILLTIRYTTKQAQEERRLSVAPYFHFSDPYGTFNYENTKTVKVSIPYDEEAHERPVDQIDIKNIGRGPALDFKVASILLNDKKVAGPDSKEVHVIESGTEASLVFYVSHKVTQLKKHFITTVPSPEVHLKKLVTVDLRYSDLIGNQYNQRIKVNIEIENSKIRFTLENTYKPEVIN